jgi:sRNA-binding protein
MEGETAPLPVTASRGAEEKRGWRTSREHIPALRERWPAAFPKDDRKVRPLVPGVAAPIAEAMGWTVGFTHGVLKGWKSSAAYCRAILRDTVRINLDGSPSDQQVDDNARAMATKRLAEIKARREREAAKKAPSQAAEALPPEPTPPPPPEPEPIVEVLETPEQIRAHLRASLLKRRAAGPSKAPQVSSNSRVR